MVRAIFDAIAENFAKQGIISEAGDIYYLSMEEIFDNIEKSIEKSESLERTMDAIRNKFGDESIDFANIIGNDIGIDY